MRSHKQLSFKFWIADKKIFSGPLLWWRYSYKIAQSFDPLVADVAPGPQRDRGNAEVEVIIDDLWTRRQVGASSQSIGKYSDERHGISWTYHGQGFCNKTVDNLFLNHSSYTNILSCYPQTPTSSTGTFWPLLGTAVKTYKHFTYQLKS